MDTQANVDSFDVTELKASLTKETNDQFTLFSNLPPELRILIWEAALPETGPHFFLFENCSWADSHFPDCSLCYDYSYADGHLHLSMFTRDYHTSDISFQNTNREARSVVQSFKRALTEGRTFVTWNPKKRRVQEWYQIDFDWKQDMISIPYGEWNKFLEAHIYLIEPVTTFDAWIHHIAIPETLLPDIHSVRELFRSYIYLDTISIVLGRQPGLLIRAWYCDSDDEDMYYDYADSSGDEEEKAERVTTNKYVRPGMSSRRWWPKDAQAGEFKYNADESRYDFTAGAKGCSEELYGHLERLANMIAEYRKEDPESAEIETIRTVLAIEY